jgi:hypothetical protein
VFPTFVPLLLPFVRNCATVRSYGFLEERTPGVLPTYLSRQEASDRMSSLWGYFPPALPAPYVLGVALEPCVLVSLPL